ncbi:MAG: thymidine phosphorylase [Chloroflexota bacterium]|nr:thymidine phosphorylase [Chloroflexota bacterium]
MFDPATFIAAKKSGARHPADQIESFVKGLVSGAVADYQVAAWAMAVCFKGLDGQETATLAEAIADSGARLDWSLPGVRVVDKHSTGGVGDKISLVAVPLAAACGLAVPKLSGRGLGITGGTLDKLESIPGLRVGLDEAQLRGQIAEHGLAIAAQSEAIAPADAILYALRDVTATIDSIPLIAASVMGKKLAGGAPTLALDVKCGRGAFMADYDDAFALAELMAEIGSAAGVAVRAYVSSMDHPLGRAVGDSLEVAEALEVLSGGGPADVVELALTIVAGLLRDSGARPAPRAAREAAGRALESGAAREKFAAMIEAQGGDLAKFQAHPPHSRRQRIEVRSAADGFVSGIDARMIGEVVRSLGGGRLAKDASVDHGVGVRICAGRGDRIAAGDLLAEAFVSDASGGAVADSVAAAFELSSQPALPKPLILGQVLRTASDADP